MRTNGHRCVSHLGQRTETEASALHPRLRSTRLFQGKLTSFKKGHLIDEPGFTGDLSLPRFLLSSLLFTLLLSFYWPASKNIIHTENQRLPSLITLMKRVFGRPRCDSGLAR